MTRGPSLIAGLYELGMIESQVAVINVNPSTRNYRSSLTFGGIPPELDSAVQSNWYHHEHNWQLYEAKYGESGFKKFDDNKYPLLDINEPMFLLFG